MSLFNRNKQPKEVDSSSLLAELALATIHDGVIITDRNGVVQFINPAAAMMVEYGSMQDAIGLDYSLLIHLESKEGRELSENENPLIHAMRTGQPLDKYQASLIMQKSGKSIPISISVMIANNPSSNRIITFRNITKELAEESEQAEFISTASHEMRTPVASIEGFLSLALNPQTATIDERARNYINSAHAASKHLGKLFKDLLDVTKLDDGRIKPHFEPVEMVSTVKQIADGHKVAASEAKLNFQFGTDDNKSMNDMHRVEQVVYGSVDRSFLQEIVDNLIDNAIKYTPEGGSVYVGVLGDGDRVLINVTDTGIGISSDDIHHIFQKFYRADNSDTRTIGGTGLGLYLAKQRTEAMGGRIWAESAFGEGSTFYVSLPRLSSSEYEKRMIAFQNQQAMMNSQPITQPRPEPNPLPPQPAPQIPTIPAPSQPQQNQPINNNLNGGIR